MTLNMLLGIHLDDNKKMNKKDISKYKWNVFDEIYLYNPDELKLIHKFINKHSDKIILATGDTNQLKSFGYDSNNIENLQQYINNCIDYMFNDRIILKEIKRLKNKEDNDKMINFIKIYLI